MMKNLMQDLYRFNEQKAQHQVIYGDSDGIAEKLIFSKELLNPQETVLNSTLKAISCLEETDNAKV